jgi:anhydro-N-acetylmuramic acid kinase
MSGTSADGINVALVRISGRLEVGPHQANNAVPESRGRSAPVHTKLDLLGHDEYPYPRNVRAAVLAAMNAPRASVADLARLNFLLGELYADAVLAAQHQFKLRVQLVGCHGQTLYHQSAARRFLGRKLAVTWQTGEAAVIAARVGVPVVSDFRPADMAVGGNGAPLVPFLDYLLFASPRAGRVVQNIGGIANLTAIPAKSAAADVIAFDTGPGNMVIDAVTEKLFGRPYDRDGNIAASGVPDEDVLGRVMRVKFFRQRPPKSAGREQFGREFVQQLLHLSGRARKQDIVATATALTARSIADAIHRFVLKRAKDRPKASYREIIVSGGGARNHTLIAMLARELAPLSLQVRLSEEFGLPSAAKEAVAFAVLAHQTWHRRPSNVPSATGAKHPAVLGTISYP